MKINQVQYKLKQLISLCLLLGLLSACQESAKPESTFQSRFDHVINELKLLEVKDGDLVFRKGFSIESQAVLLADVNGDYSHVGIIVIRNDTPFVIHVVPDSIQSSIDYTLKEELLDFFHPEFAAKGCIMRIKPSFEAIAKNSADTAYRFYENHISFDGGYDLLTDDKMYCTELIWKAYLFNSIDLVNENLSKLNIPLIKNKIIFPSALTNNSLFQKIYYF